MLDLSQVEIKISEEKDGVGIVVIEPLDQGYGHTLGNSLRRVMLSSLSGAAFTQAKISSVRHQFTTLSGMSEDIIEFILNLKKVRLHLEGDKPVRITLDAKGPGEVKASDLNLPGGVTVANKDQVLAHLSDSKSKLSAVLTAEKGEGYRLAEENRTNEVGVIPIDSQFSPVVKVNYQVEATRVGRLTNFDKLTIEIETDGTVKPSEAIKKAAEILVAQFTLVSLGETKRKTVVAEAADEPKVSPEILKMTLEELDLPVRLTNSLKASKVETIGDYLTTPESKLLKVKNFGVKSKEQVEEKLKEVGVNIPS